MKRLVLATICMLILGGVTLEKTHGNELPETPSDTVRIAYSTEGWGGTAYHETKRLPLHPDDIIVAPERAENATLCVGRYVKTGRGARIMLAGANARGARAQGTWMVTLNLDNMAWSAEYAERGKGDFHELQFSLSDIRATVFTECPKSLLKEETGESTARIALLGTIMYLIDVIEREKIEFADEPTRKKRTKKR